MFNTFRAEIHQDETGKIYLEAGKRWGVSQWSVCRQTNKITQAFGQDTQKVVYFKFALKPSHIVIGARQYTGLTIELITRRLAEAVGQPWIGDVQTTLRHLDSSFGFEKGYWMYPHSKDAPNVGQPLLVFSSMWMGPRPGTVVMAMGGALVNINVQMDGERDRKLLSKIRSRPEGNTYVDVPVFDKLSPEQRTELAAGKTETVWAEWGAYPCMPCRSC